MPVYLINKPRPDKLSTGQGGGVDKAYTKVPGARKEVEQ